jgi:glycogen synthase
VRKMKILFWAEAFWPYQIGGLEVLGAEFLTAIQKRGYEIIVVTSDYNKNMPAESIYQGMPVYCFPFYAALESRNLRDMKALTQRLAELRRAFKPDLIHVNFSGPTIFFHLRTQNATPARTLVAVHTPPRITAQTNSLLGELMQSANWVVSVSNAISSDVRRRVPEIESRSCVIFNGLPMPAIEPTPLSFDAPRIVCLGRIVVEKGFDVALTAFSKVVERSPTARFVIGGDGPARRDLERQTDELGLRASVEFIGWVNPDQVPKLLNDATMVLMPSRWQEPFGLVALQAAQMARPVIATRDGGLPEVVQHDATGLIIERDDTDGLAHAIAFLLDHPAIAARMGTAARKRAQEWFGFERFVNEYDALYRKLGNGAA